MSTGLRIVQFEEIKLCVIGYFLPWIHNCTVPPGDVVV